MAQERGFLEAVQVDKGPEFISRVVGQWAYANDMALHFILGGPYRNQHWIVCGLKYASIEMVDARDLFAEPDCGFRVRRLGSTRHKELASPKFAAFGDCWCRGRIWNYLRCDAGPNRNAQAPVKRGHEPKNGRNHGRVSGPLDLLRFIDSFATSGAMEHHRGVGQFVERRRVLVLRRQRKTSTSESVKRIPIGSLPLIGRILRRS